MNPKSSMHRRQMRLSGQQTLGVGMCAATLRGRRHENGGWKIKLIIFLGGTSGSVHTQTLNDNLKDLQSQKEMSLGKFSFMSC
jgi:hypothetical protein